MFIRSSYSNQIKEILTNGWQEIKCIWVCEWHKAKAKAWTAQILRAEAEELEAQKKRRYK